HASGPLLDTAAKLRRIHTVLGLDEDVVHEVAFARDVTGGMAVASINDWVGGKGRRHIAHADEHGTLVIELKGAAQLIWLLAPHVLVAGLVDDDGVGPLEVVHAAHDHVARRAHERFVIQPAEADVAGVAVFQPGPHDAPVGANGPGHARHATHAHQVDILQARRFVEVTHAIVHDPDVGVADFEA